MENDESAGGTNTGGSFLNQSHREQKNEEWADTFSNRMLYWKYSDEQKKEFYAALEAGVPKEQVMQYFYPDVSPEEMRLIRDSYASKH